MSAGDDPRFLIAPPAGAWQKADAARTRPANATAYALNGAIGDAAASLFKFSGFFRQNGGTALLTGAKLVFSLAAITVPTGIAVRGHFFNAVPSVNPVDQATLTTMLADHDAKLGYADFASFIKGGAGSDAIEGYGSFVNGSFLPAMASGSARDLYMLLESQGAWTPPNAGVVTPYVMAEQN